jgi:sRNA-binding protein
MGMKKSLFAILVGLAVGYVLGARAGRERYDLIVEKVSGVWEDPRVAKARGEAARYAREQAPVIRDKAQAVAKAAPGVVADRAKDVAATAKNVADRTVATGRKVADRATTVATDAAGTAASRVGEVRDSVLEDDDEDGLS